jgi:hypothetical protein
MHSLQDFWVWLAGGLLMLIGIWLRYLHSRLQLHEQVCSATRERLARLETLMTVLNAKVDRIESHLDSLLARWGRP